MRRSWSSIGVLAVAFLAVLATATACGVPHETSFQPVGDDETPFALGTTPTSDTLVDQTVGITPPAAIYLVDADGSIVRRPRTGIVDVAAALALLSSPEPSRNPDLRSALPADTVVAVDALAASPESVVLTIGLAPSFLELPVDEQRLALAQIVLTSTDRAEDLGVAFAIDGTVVNVPRSDASVSEGPVGRTDYLDLLAG